MTEAKKRPVGKIVGIVAGVLLGTYAFYGIATDTDAAEPTHHAPSGLSEGEAWNACKQAVAERLRNPESADFTLLSTDIADQPDGGWSIAGSLKAKNDFGVEREIGYSCRISANGHIRTTVS